VGFWIPINQVRAQHLLLRHSPALRYLPLLPLYCVIHPIINGICLLCYDSDGRLVRLLQPRFAALVIIGVGCVFLLIALICGLSYERYRELRSGHECYVMQEWPLWLPLNLLSVFRSRHVAKQLASVRDAHGVGTELIWLNKIRASMIGMVITLYFTCVAEAVVSVDQNAHLIVYSSIFNCNGDISCI
jgi:hypothetical protein